MAIDFPASPTTGQIFNAANGLTYRYSGTVWESVPYDTALPYNYVVNPSFTSSQENGGNAVASGLYPADQWQVSSGVVGSTVQRLAATSPNNSAYVLRTTSAAKATLLAVDYVALVQTIEGFRIAANRYGTASALPMVLRFWVRSSQAGTFGGGIRDGSAEARSYTFSYTISAGQVNSWVPVVIPIPGDVAGTWAKEAAAAVNVWLVFASGGTYNTAPGVWTAGNFICATGITNAVSSVAATYDIADVGLYLDPLNTGRPPPWQRTEPTQDRLDCLRYWYAIRNMRGVGHPSLFARGACLLPTAMRAKPALTIVAPFYAWDQGAILSMNSLNNYSTEQIAEIDGTMSGPLTVGRGAITLPDYPGYLAASARM